MKRLQSLFMAWIFPWVPKRLVSRTTGLLMRLPLPPPFAGVLIRLFAWTFAIDVTAAEKPAKAYRSWDEFFTRRLKPGLRQVAGDLIHPVDGKLSVGGDIRSGELLQAKGWTYSLAEFLGDGKLAETYEGGKFLTYYLCPSDYHRVHAPAAGELVSAQHIPGLLWPVNEWSVNNIRRLFNLNERVVLNFTSPRGRWSLVMVGATNVGQMTISLDPSIATNRWMWHAPNERSYSPPVQVSVGDEVGIFHLGSTVVCLFERRFTHVKIGQIRPGPVKFGEVVPYNP